jgi:exo-beta-1,3-glucanase (GH17 family)
MEEEHTLKINCPHCEIQEDITIDFVDVDGESKINVYAKDCGNVMGQIDAPQIKVEWGVEVDKKHVDELMKEIKIERK